MVIKWWFLEWLIFLVFINFLVIKVFIVLFELIFLIIFIFLWVSGWLYVIIESVFIVVWDNFILDFFLINCFMYVEVFFFVVSI